MSAASRPGNILNKALQEGTSGVCQREWRDVWNAHIIFAFRRFGRPLITALAAGQIIG